MRPFNEREKGIIQKLLDSRNSEAVQVSQFIQEYWFQVQSKRALILQTQGHFAAFFLAPQEFDDTQKRHEEIQRFFELVSLLDYLSKNAYLTFYRMKTEKFYFFQESFDHIKATSNSIVLNEQGDYTFAPDTIHDKNKSTIYKGIIFSGGTYELILSVTTGILLVSDKLYELVKEQPPVNGNSTLSKAAILISTCCLAFLLTFIFFYYVKDSSKNEKKTAAVTDSISAPISLKGSLSVPADSNHVTEEIIPETDTSKITYLRGIDISKWNGNAAAEIDPGDSITFIICKATEGTTIIDPDFDNNWQIIKAKKSILGTYHFYQVSDDPVKQAQHFLSTVGSKGQADMVPIVDIEQGSIPPSVQPQESALQNNLLQFLSYIEEKCNCIPMIYTNTGFADQYLMNNVFSKYPLWLAAYSNAKNPQLPFVWKKKGYKIWQKQDSYFIDSHVYDFDVFYGKKTDLYK